MSTVWARCVRGLEPVVAEEIAASGLGTVVDSSHRNVLLDAPGPEGALALRTVDDVYLLVGDVRDIVRERASLARLAAAVDDLPLQIAPNDRSIGVTASFLGKRNYNRFELEDAVGGALAARLSQSYVSRTSGGVPPPDAAAWRVHVEDDRALIGLRLASAPLHRRGYKVAAPPGTLHPPVAAAMAMLAGVHDVDVVLDPTAGAGTLLVEAAALAPASNTIGVDIDDAMTRAALANGARVARGDAASLPLRAHSVDVVLANLPWGRQAPLVGSLDGVWSEIVRVLRPAGGRSRVAVLSESELDPPLPILRQLPLSLMGSHPMLTVLGPA